jgi:ketosteroid isomerase-like protein
MGKLMRMWMLLFAAALSAQEFDQWSKLVEAERVFSKCSVEKSMRQAFVEFLSDEAIIFRPQAVPGRPFYAAKQENPNLLLKWEPEVAELSALADLGYTTGPYELTITANGRKTTSRGYFVTMWKKQADDSWKVALDTGIDYDGARMPVAQVGNPRNGQHWPRKKADTSGVRSQLMQADMAFNDMAARQGVKKALQKYFAESVRVYRDHHAPYLVERAWQDSVVSCYADRTWKPDFAAVSAAGDLGYTYGLCVSTESSAGKSKESYVRFWRRRGEVWQVVLDLALHWPEEA